MSLIPDGYYRQLAKVESSNNPNAKAKTSSASGLYQFTKGTWEALGYNWGDVFNTDLQNKAIDTFTSKNASILAASGINVDAGALYGAHFLGAGTAKKIYTAGGNQSLENLLPASVIKANSFLKGMTVDDFKSWASKKMGSVGQSSIQALGTTATQILGIDPKGLLEIDPKDILKGADTVITDTIGKVLGTSLETDKGSAEEKSSGSIFKWIKDFFSADTAARAVAVIIGIGFVGIAVIYLSGTDRIVMETAKTAVKLAA